VQYRTEGMQGNGSRSTNKGKRRKVKEKIRAGTKCKYSRDRKTKKKGKNYKGRCKEERILQTLP
jgi:hypothetical protein